MAYPITFLWTVPRSVSTSFERMMSERGDHVVFDEPFSRRSYFGPDRRSSRFAESLEGSSSDELLDELEHAAGQRPVFVKDMAYQAAGLLGPELLERFRNSFLVRDPAATLRSLAGHWPDFTDEEAGWDALAQPPPPGPRGSTSSVNRPRRTATSHGSWRPTSTPSRSTSGSWRTPWVRRPEPPA